MTSIFSRTLTVLLTAVLLIMLATAAVVGFSPKVGDVWEYTIFDSDSEIIEYGRSEVNEQSNKGWHILPIDLFV